VKQGETLNLIAAEEYDDPAEWRRIAEANGIADPMDVKPGTVLVLPPIL
jgi:nucleoid-associated protein YgaU